MDDISIEFVNSNEKSSGLKPHNSGERSDFSKAIDYNVKNDAKSRNKRKKQYQQSYIESQEDYNN